MGVTIVGNLLVIIMVAHFKVLHNPTNFFVLSLAVADFGIGALILPFSIVRCVEMCWYFGDVFCRLHTCMDTVFCIASIFNLCFISIDRYYAICDPLRYPVKVTDRVTFTFIGAGWFISVSYPAAILYGNIIDGWLSYLLPTPPCIDSCQLMFNRLWGWVMFPVFFVPCVIMISLYLRIFVVATRQARIINSMAEKSRDSAGMPSKRERKAAKTLGIAVGVYLMCWIPFVLDTMSDLFTNYSTPPFLFEFIMWIQYSNSTWNPIIYGFFYPWFRKALKAIFT
uniref:G-protein coupled receptors family 1 profile domain-containing protein n=1 Tax=Latimeria chalumnae TaxID=7897 RepID=M3XHG6_LATCH